MSNQEIREAFTKSGVKQWQIAEEMGVSEFTFSRRMRRELPPAEKEKIFSAIRKVAKKEGKE